MTDKVILSNGSALTTKYGAAAVKKIRGAIRELIQADSARGLHTLYIELDNAAAMKKYGKAVVIKHDNPKQNKLAVDAIYKSLAPDYIMLLGAVDIIPHQRLTNPLFKSAKPDDDPDQTVPSDLPYACEAPYSTLIENFTGPTRVVGRLPDLTGGGDPSYLIHLLRTAAGATPRARADYQSYFSVSAQPWKKSTALSLDAVFGAGTDEQSCPPALPPWKPTQLACRSHFINCHGARRSSHFYGQHRESYPASLEAAQLDGLLTNGVVAAMECCYGAELFAPHDQPGMGNTYLGNGAFGYVGSTTIAYGPASTNDWADNICKFFFESVLTGASLGRAMLEARQKYIHGAATPIGPVDLKTLAQFLLLGDPSICPVASPVVAASRASRIERRKDLMTNGLALAATWPVVRSRQIAAPTGRIRALLQSLAREIGMTAPSVTTFKPATSRAASQPRALMARQPDVTAVHVLMESRPPTEEGIHRSMAVVVREAAGRVVSVHQGYAK